MDYTREKLVIDNIPFADGIAYQKKRHLPPFVDVEEIKSAAYMGLVDAASKFDSTVGVFHHYACFRIRGAIADYLRELDWGTRGNSQTPSSIDGGEFPLRDSLVSKRQCSYNIVGQIAPSKKAEEILHKYFFDGQSLKEIADDYNVSESRICQMLSAYKAQIKRKWTRDELSAEIAA